MRGMRAIASADAFPTQKFDAERSTSPRRWTSPAALSRRACGSTSRRPFCARDDMTVSAEVVVARKTNALSIPANAVRESLIARWCW